MKSAPRVELLQVTLDLLILHTLAFAPSHGHAIARHIQRTSEEMLQIETGSLYPALHRLEAKRLDWRFLAIVRQGKTRAVLPPNGSRGPAAIERRI